MKIVKDRTDVKHEQLLMSVWRVNFHFTDRANCTNEDGSKVDYMVRCYRNSPSDVILQLRGATEKRGQLADVHLNAKECREVAAKLIELADQLTD
jgi:hypothetical protein